MTSLHQTHRGELREIPILKRNTGFFDSTIQMQQPARRTLLVRTLIASIKGKDAPDTINLKGQGDPINDLLNKIQETPNADYATLARDLRVSEATVKRNIQKLKQQNRLRRVGSKKTGLWEIIE